MQLYNTLSAEERAELIDQAGEQRLTLSFYAYAKIKDPKKFRDDLFIAWNALDALGRIYVAYEGINAQMSIPAINIEAFRETLETYDFMSGIRLNVAVEHDDHSFLKLTILTDKNKPLSLLDVGCGDGRFFDQVRQSEISNIELCGLDPTEGCVATCKAKGYTVFCMNIANFKSAFPDRSFDAVTAYHVLEHIADPKKFLSELISLISGTGAIYISTPYSPMNFELAWYDVLNHPPHHMGRWNLEVYKKLAANLKLKLEVFMPAGEGLLKAATLSFMFATHGPLTTYPKIKILKSIARHPIKFFKHLHKQSQRTKIAGKRVSNVILVKFTKLQGALGIANI